MLILFNNAIVISLVQVPCSFYWTILFALIFFKDPQQYNHPPIYGDHVSSV